MKKLFVVLILLVAMNASGQWVQLGNSPLYDISSFVELNGNIYAGTSGNGVIVTTNNGINWETMNNGLNNLYINSFAIVGTDIFAGTGGGVYFSSNNGLNWTTVGLTIFGINALAVLGNKLYAGGWGPYAGSGGVYLSTNNGLNWSSVGLVDKYITSLAVSDSKLYAGSIFNNDGMFMSTNDGANWTIINNGLTNFSINALAVLGTNIYAGTSSYPSGGIHISTNNGVNWSLINNGLTNNDIRSLTVSETNIFAGTAGGVFLTTNNGANWVAKNQGFNMFPAVFALFVANNYIFAGTYQNAAWRRIYSDIVVLQNINTEVSSSYSLSQNYPNPFNPRTVISFQLPVDSKVLIKVYDVQGREVQTLVNGRMNAGVYETTFDGAGQNSGVYFYRLTTEGFSETKRMMLLK